MMAVLGTAHRAGLAGAAAALGVYLITLAPSVGFIDAGELAAVAHTLGIAHPTGYPLFTLLGRIASMIPLPVEEIVRLNLVSALLCAAGVYVFAGAAGHVLLVSGVLRAGARGGRGAAPVWVLPAAVLGGALVLAFTRTYWATAVVVEVYALHVLFLALLLRVFLRAALPVAEVGARSPFTSWLLFAFLLGLAFGNHMTTILLAPALLYLYFATQGIGRRSLRTIGLMVPFFLAGLSVYAYLPLRAAEGALLNWGNPVTLERFLWHFTGKQYRVWIFSSGDVAARQLGDFLSALPAEGGYAALLAALIGGVVLFAAHRKLGITAILLFGGCVAYAINYDIHDIASYFLLAHMTVALLAVVGLAELLRRMAVRTLQRAGGGLAVAVLVAVPCLVLHPREAGEQGNHLVEDYTMNMFSSLKPEAVVFSYQWDYWVSASFYYQLVRGVRSDVVVVDKELMRRSWYFRELSRRWEWLIRENRDEVDAFLVELAKFERDLPYDPRVIEGKFVGMISTMIRRSMVHRPVYVTAEIEPEFTRGLRRIPEGLAFRITADTGFIPTSMPEMQYRPFPRRGRLEDQIPRLYASAFGHRGLYYYSNGELAEAARSLQKGGTFGVSVPELVRLADLLRGAAREGSVH